MVMVVVVVAAAAAVVVVVVVVVLMLQNMCLCEAQERHTAVIYGFFRHSRVYWLYLED
jgi:hypothetical protein